MSIPRHLLKEEHGGLPGVMFGLPMQVLPSGWYGAISSDRKQAAIALWVPEAEKNELRAQFSRDVKVYVANLDGLTYLWARKEGDIVDAALMLDEYTAKLTELGYKPVFYYDVRWDVTRGAPATMTTKKRRDILVLDYESFWSDDYSLSKMSTIKYVRDPRFKAHGAALRLNGAPAEWVTGSHLQSVLDNDIDWANTVLIGHNLPFDGLILAERNNQWPALYLDTLGMARCLIGGAIPSRSLDALGEHFGLGGKTDKGKALYATKGVRDLSPQQERSMGEYACRDADLTAAIFNRMWPEFPKKLVSTLDWTIRMMTEPGVVLNADIMRECHETEVELKRNAVANCRLTKTQLNSNSQFADVLREHGIEPPTKISRTTGKETYAFSKQDQAFTDLQDDPNPDVRDLVMARLAVKSSIEETRSKAYLELAEDGKLCPVPLLFCGAMQTGRLSSADGYGWLNIARNSRIRDGVEAPDGYVFVEADSSNIELRVVATFCGQTDLVDMLRAGGDAYSDFASDLFNTPVTKALTKTDPIIAGYRQTGKVSLLSAQYGVGAKTFKQMLWVQAALRVDLDEAERIVKMYRKRYQKISGMWKLLDQQLAVMATGQAPHAMGNSQPVKWHADRIELPSGFCLKYPDLRWVTDSQTGRKQLAFTSYGGKSAGTKYIWGGTLLENCMAGDTQVAVSRGWVRLDSVLADDLVWDGVEWVRHGGLVAQGMRTTIDFGGVRMTPDHRVWTGTWEPAERAEHGKATAAYAQESTGPDWTAVRDVHRRSARRVSCGERREDAPGVGRPLCLRQQDGAHGTGFETGSELRMLRRDEGAGAQHEARHVGAPRVRGVALYDRQVPAAVAQGMEELRRAWHSSVRRLGAVVRRFLERHGVDVPYGSGPRSDQQRRGVFAAELSMDFATGQQPQQAEQRADRGWRGVVELSGRREEDGRSTQYADVPMGAGRAWSSAGVATEQQPEAVYDIRDCGPRNRFVVRGDDGRPFIVHNCGQSLAREIIDPQVQAIRQRYPVVLQVHDAVLALVPESEAEEGTEFVRECMSQAPVWWTDIPIACEAGFGKTYGGIKKS